MAREPCGGDAARDGQTISLSPGTHVIDRTLDTGVPGPETPSAPRAIVISGAINDATGLPRSTVIVDGGVSSPCRVFQSISGEGTTTILRNLEIRGGEYSIGAGCYFGSSSTPTTRRSSSCSTNLWCHS